MVARVATLQLGDHIFATYRDRKTRFEEICEFAKTGLERNQLVLLLTSGKNKNSGYRTAKKLCKYCSAGVKKKNLIIKTASEWYFPDEKFDSGRTITLWKSFTRNAIKNGKRGLWAFADVDEFFTRGLVKEVVDYESLLKKRFSFPLTAVCAYDSKNIDKLTAEQVRRLHGHHLQTWKADPESRLDTESLGLLSLIMKKPRLLRVCRVLKYRRMYTREVLTELSGWQYSHKHLKEAIRHNLIKLERGRVAGNSGQWAHFHELTGKGLRLLELSDELV